MWLIKTLLNMVLYYLYIQEFTKYFLLDISVQSGYIDTKKILLFVYVWKINSILSVQ